MGSKNIREHEIETDDGDIRVIEIPQRWEICGLCDGEGKHSRAVDGNGITSSEWSEWSHEEQECYLSGGYDRTCEKCLGDGKVLVDNLDALSPEDRKIIEEYWEDEADYNRVCAMERMMGA